MTDNDKVAYPSALPDFLKQTKSARKTHVVYHQLKNRIVIGEMTRDSDITEQSLAQEFGCSQGTVREALLSLQEDGLVERLGYQGTYVTILSQDEACLLAKLRLAVECTGMARAVSRLTPEGMVELRKLAAAYLDARATGDPYICAEVDRTLHMTLFSHAEMPTLVPILNRAILQLHRFTISSHKGFIRWQDLEQDPHSVILDALESGNKDKAVSNLSRHIIYSLTKLAPEVAAVLQAEDLNEMLLST